MLVRSGRCRGPAPALVARHNSPGSTARALRTLIMPNTCRSDEPYLAFTPFSAVSVRVLKTAMGGDTHRGFESHALRWLTGMNTRCRTHARQATGTPGRPAGNTRGISVQGTVPSTGAAGVNGRAARARSRRRRRRSGRTRCRRHRRRAAHAACRSPSGPGKTVVTRTRGSSSRRASAAASACLLAA